LEYILQKNKVPSAYRKKQLLHYEDQSKFYREINEVLVYSLSHKVVLVFFDEDNYLQIKGRAASVV
jgi:hypothetical protein